MNADNQQARLCELSWLGGIIDGEGCVTVRKSTTGPYGGPLVSISNTDKLIISKVVYLFNKHHIAYHVRHIAAKAPRKAKKEISVSGFKRVPRLLALIEPYLISKQQRAILLRTFCTSRLKAGKVPYSDYEKDLCEQIWVFTDRGTKW